MSCDSGSQRPESEKGHARWDRERWGASGYISSDTGDPLAATGEARRSAWSSHRVCRRVPAAPLASSRASADLGGPIPGLLGQSTRGVFTPPDGETSCEAVSSSRCGIGVRVGMTSEGGPWSAGASWCYRPLGVRETECKGRTAAGVAGWPVGGPECRPRVHTHGLAGDGSEAREREPRVLSSAESVREDVHDLGPGRRNPERTEWPGALEVCAPLETPGERGREAPGREVNPTEPTGAVEQESPQQKRAEGLQVASEQVPRLPVVTGQQRHRGESCGASPPPARPGDPEGQR